MKSLLVASTLSVLASATPIYHGKNTNSTMADLERRQGKGFGIQCGPVASIYCKGTFEPTSNGIVVGSQYQAALRGVLPKGSQFHSVDYANGVIGYLSGGAADGIANMRNMAQNYVSKCSGIKLVLAGYSQGAQVTHRALGGANQATKDATRAVVLFGDPMAGRPIPGIPKDRIYTHCAVGDGICTGLPLVTVTHLAYAADFGGAVAFVRKQLGGAGGSSIGGKSGKGEAKGGLGKSGKGEGKGAKGGAKGGKGSGGKGAKGGSGGKGGGGKAGGGGGKGKGGKGGGGKGSSESEPEKKPEKKEEEEE